MLALTESEADGYMVGSSLSQRLCIKKMQEEIAILRITINTADVQKVILTEETGPFDKIGIVGSLFSECRSSKPIRALLEI